MKAVFDIGGPYLRVAFSRGEQTLTDVISHDTPEAKEVGFDLLRSTVLGLCAKNSEHYAR